MRRMKLYRIMAVAAAISLLMPVVAAPVVAAEKAKPYVVVMAAEPITAYDGGARGLAPTKVAPGKKVDPRSLAVRNYQAFLRTQHDKSLSQSGVAVGKKLHDYSFALNGYAAMLTPSQVERIEVQKGVVRVLEDQMRQPQTDSVGKFLGLTANGGAYDRGVDGEDVVVGVIDTGIWPEHPSFADNGSYGPSPVDPVPCEFGNTAHNANDVAFTCNDKLLGARQMLATYRAVIGAEDEEFDSARDDSGHGTHTASTAAGNAGVAASIFGLPVARISGVAPRARVIAYKALGELGGFTSDLAAAIDMAVSDGVDVINYSIGGGAGLPGADDIAFLFAANSGVFVATSAGNDGPGAGTVGSPAVMPWVTAVGASTQRRFFEGVVVLGNGKRYRGASVTRNLGSTPLVDAANAGSDICEPGELDPAVVTGKVVLCIRGVVGRAEKSKAVFEAGGVGMIMYNTNNVDNLFTDNHWVPSVHIDNTPGLAIKAYIASAANPTARISVRTPSGQPRKTSWPPRAHDDDLLVTRPERGRAGRHQAGHHSSWSPDPRAAIRPSLTPRRPRVSCSRPSPERRCRARIVAGIYALLKQAHPDWSAAAARSALMTTAHQSVRDNDRVSRADPFDFGAGHVRPGGRWGKGSISQPGLVYDAGLFEYAAFTCGMEWEVFDQASCDFLESQGVPSSPVDLNLPSIGISEVAGSQTVTRTVTSVATSNAKVTYKASVRAPSGFKVKVSPSTITLRRGQSATFTVTVTNVRAPIGTWRFGSLTWKAKDYSVRSPIAVKGALFDAPDEVSGTGTSGTLSFPVKFGYTGSYTAAAHGLVPATVTHDNVLQDPNQTFDPADVAAGGANLHEFTLSGAAHFRIAMPPEGTEADADLDIYVVGPNGEEASSTSGGTDELIDIPAPAERDVEGLCPRLGGAGRQLRLRHVDVGGPERRGRWQPLDHVGTDLGDQRHGRDRRGRMERHHDRSHR